MKIDQWLIYRAGTNKLRTVTKRPRLDADEIGWRLTIDVPAPWGQVIGNVALALPAELPSGVTAAEPCTADDNPPEENNDE
jgi:hypothetical protein